MRRKLFTVCIPAYNRAQYLVPLLDSILIQDFEDYNILICEDDSPEREGIREIVKGFQASYPNRIRYHENQINLGYDGNIRELVHHAEGEFCVFMGNDDLMCEGALAHLSDVVARNKNCGVVVRTYATFDADPNQHKQVFRYFPDELVVNAGTNAIAIGFRRSVVIPGMVIHRDSAESKYTKRFDGTLLYQLYLVGLILAEKDVVFTPKIIALRRDGTPPDFGNSESEKGHFVPADQTPESSLFFVEGMLRIAQFVAETSNTDVYRLIKKDIVHYSYPILSIQANRSKKVFFNYGCSLGRMGFWRSPLFVIYFSLLLIIKPVTIDSLVLFIKRRLGYTPRLGSLFGRKK